MENIQSSSKSQKIKLDFKDSKYATGRRKTSIARVWVKKGTGKIFVNGKTMDDYFTSDNHKMQIVRPFEIINQSTSYDVRCSVKGGGPTGQAGAMVHGISKALVLFDETLKATLKTEITLKQLVSTVVIIKAIQLQMLLPSLYIEPQRINLIAQNMQPIFLL